MKRNALLLIRQFFQALFIIMPNACPEAIDIGALLRDVQRISTMFKHTAHDEPKKKGEHSTQACVRLFFM